MGDRATTPDRPDFDKPGKRQRMPVFSPDDRERVRDRLLQLAASDTRVVAGAAVGSLARDDGDRWSDLDLTFAVADGVPIRGVLDDWTRLLVREFDAAQLFDLPAGATIYRVFLLPGCLQVDLSFTPTSEFGARGPKFRLLFGTAVERPHTEPPSARELFGYAVHHALRARFCVERGRYWQAEYWVSSLRDYALTLACRRRGLPARHGRGFDDLPADVRDAFEGGLARSLDRNELLRALSSNIAGLLREADEVQGLAAKVEPELKKLTAEWDGEPRSEDARLATGSGHILCEPVPGQPANAQFPD
jgi:hypothetical protein